VGYTK